MSSAGCSIGGPQHCPDSLMGPTIGGTRANTTYIARYLPDLAWPEPILLTHSSPISRQEVWLQMRFKLSSLTLQLGWPLYPVSLEEPEK